MKIKIRYAYFKGWYIFLGPYTALWWIPQGHIPTVEEAKERLEYLRAHAESAYAFSLKKPFPASGANIEAPVPFSDECLA